MEIKYTVVRKNRKSTIKKEQFYKTVTEKNVFFFGGYLLRFFFFFFDRATMSGWPERPRENFKSPKVAKLSV